MDQLLGAAAAAAGLWGMTAHLELDYRGPLPLETPLVLRAGWPRATGRKSLITGTIALAAAPDEVARRGPRRVRHAAAGEARGLLRRDHRRLRPAHARRDRPGDATAVPTRTDRRALRRRGGRRPRRARRPTSCCALRARRARPGAPSGTPGTPPPSRRSSPSSPPSGPDDVVFSEEAADDPRRLSADRVWIVDPLDGTREYGEPDRHDWAVHVALWSAGELTAAAVALPALGEVLVTDPAPALPAARRRAGPDRRQPHPPARPWPPPSRRPWARELVPLGLGRLQDRRRRPRARSTPTSTPAACTSGTPPRRSPSPGRPG